MAASVVEAAKPGHSGGVKVLADFKSAGYLCSDISKGTQGRVLRWALDGSVMVQFDGVRFPKRVAPSDLDKLGVSTTASSSQGSYVSRSFSWGCRAFRRSLSNPAPAGHPLRGVSVHFLATSFLEEVESAGQTRTAKVFEVEPTVIRPRGAAMSCPRDLSGKLGAAYVDCLSGEDNVGRATQMLSYSWGYEVGDVVDTLVAFCGRKGLDPRRTYVWICCLCVNQHRVQEAQARGDIVPFEEFEATFRDRVQGIGNIICMMAPWRDPHYLTRIWCIFEVYTAYKGMLHAEIAMPPRETDDLIYCICTGNGLEVIWDPIRRVMVENAQASVEDDRKHILALIEQMSSFRFLNMEVCSLFRGWFSDMGDVLIKDVLDGSRCTPANSKCFGHLSRQLSSLYFQLGQFEKAYELSLRAIEIRTATGMINTLEGAIMHHNVANILYEQNYDARAALKHLYLSRALHQIVGPSPDGAFTNAVIALRCYEVEEVPLHDLRATVQTSLDVYRRTEGSMDSKEYAALLQWQAAAEVGEGQVAEALEKLEEAVQIRANHGDMQSVFGTRLLLGLGHAQVQAGDLDGARSSLTTVCDQVERFGLQGGDGVGLCLVESLADMKRGEVREAQRHLEEAMNLVGRCGRLSCLVHLLSGMLVSILSGDDAAGRHREKLLPDGECGAARRHPWTAASLRTLAHASALAGSPHLAREALEMARELHEFAGSLDSSEGSAVSRALAQSAAAEGQA